MKTKALILVPLLSVLACGGEPPTTEVAKEAVLDAREGTFVAVGTHGPFAWIQQVSIFAGPMEGLDQEIGNSILIKGYGRPGDGWPMAGCRTSANLAFVAATDVSAARHTSLGHPTTPGIRPVRPTRHPWACSSTLA